MNIFIMVDMEGISGIFDPDQVGLDRFYYSTGRRYMTWDVNACVEGCIQGGAKKIIVRDAHASAKNLIWEELSPHAEYIMGRTGEQRMPGIEGCDGLILLGYHAMAGTAAGILEHTWSSKSWQNCWLNGKLTGEVGIEAGIAGDYGKPVIMVSGDDKVCREAEDILPGVVTAQVKIGTAFNGGRLLSMTAAHELIRSKAAEAVKKCGQLKPYSMKPHVTLRLELVERNQLPHPAEKPYMKIIDGRTYEVSASTVEEALYRL